ncbi:MAG: (E)-4-hydroxy-3-methylbut-2-enyl-diphosphate synthase [Bacteroidota bacterium]
MGSIEKILGNLGAHGEYCVDLLNRKRLPTLEVQIGKVRLGGENPIRLQSMTTTDTMDTSASVEQSIRMIDAGCEIVRLTAPSKKEAENLGVIREELLKRGYDTPLVADIHFTPNAAEIAAKLVEKVRVNPGNYADKKKFEELEYTDDSYLQELERIEEKFTPLVLLCKEHGTAMRIGTNHGSLSDRILSRYGDTPEGMVESAYEFIRICEKRDFHNLVISMKASNTLVVVQAYRLLVARMIDNGKCYPLHLGVTEAGDGEDGRIKSAVGIGTLLEDGIGDTIRVSLTEEPEFEIPVARKLAEKFNTQTNVLDLPLIGIEDLPYNPFAYSRRKSSEIGNIGGKHAPVVIGDLSGRDALSPASLFPFGYAYSQPLDKWHIKEPAADYIYIGKHEINFEAPGMLGVIVDLSIWNTIYQEKSGFYPLVREEELTDELMARKIFLLVKTDQFNADLYRKLPLAILVADTNYSNWAHVIRYFHLNIAKNNIVNPVILRKSHHTSDEENFQLSVASEIGSQLIDGFGDGVWIESNVRAALVHSSAFGILQATRTRISKTEYISCPSCGRTLFDLQETTTKIRKVTSHLKGIKIGIMGCIVNGPGEMADADYGYVGTGPGKINLYKEKNVVKRNVPEDQAVEALVELIRENGDWVEPVNH